MSVEDAKGFLKRMATDSDFAAGIQAAKTSDDRVAMIRAAGYDFTSKELAEARTFQLTDEESRKIALSSDELHAIAGGAHCGYTHESEGHCGHTHESESHCGFTHESEAAHITTKVTEEITEHAAEVAVD